jgi:hypothetical protein
VDIQFSSNICWRCCLFSIMCFWLLFQKSSGCSCVDLCLGLLFCSIGHCVYFLCQHQAVFILTVLLYTLKSGIVITLALDFLLRIALAVQSLLRFHANFRMDFSISVKNIIGILIGIALNM